MSTPTSPRAASTETTGASIDTRPWLVLRSSIWKAPIDQHGAGLYAAQRADELMAAGDMEGRAVWHRIERAIDELQRTAPGHGEGVH